MMQMSFDREHLEKPDVSKMNEQDLAVLQDWVDKMDRKYPVIGTIANSAGL